MKRWTHKLLVILQDGTKLPIKNEHFPVNSDLPEINSNYGNGIPKAIIDWINENPESQSILAKSWEKNMVQRN